jgi:hypothetical protein
MRQFIKKIIKKKGSFNSASYWERRYVDGGNSGDGSYGRLALFKATFLNAFISENNIHTSIEFGCGDGHQLSLIQYPKYLGLDVSATIIRSCADKFKEDPAKSFLLYDTNAFFNRQFIFADLTLSLDVIYHIVEEPLFKKYLEDLFAASTKYVIIFSTNFDKAETVHVFHRQFLKYVQQSIPGFELVTKVSNPYPGTGEQESEADFFIFKRI